MRAGNIRDIMTGSVTCCTPTTRIDEVARVMRDQDCGSLPVVDEQDGKTVIGMITDRDIVCRIVAEEKSATQEIVRHAMSKNIVAVDEQADIAKARDLMEQHQVRRLPVVRGKNQLVGIVAAADIARTMHEKPVGEMLKSISDPTTAI